MTTSDPALAPLDVLVGTWETEATHPMLDGIVTGSVTFEWLAGGRFLVQRTHHDHDQVPDAIAVIGPPEDGDGLVMEYFDSRGVRRTYAVSVEDGLLRWWRDEPGFEQRYSAALGPEEFVGEGQLARRPGEWEDDLRVVYRRVRPDA
jgi:hypothetical protein